MFVNILTSAASWDSEHQLLTYLVPAELEDSIRVGQLVAVPYGERLVEGLIWELIAPPAPPDTQFERDLSPSLGAAIHSARSFPTRSLLDPIPEGSLRPIHTILDLEPALLSHQIALAQWISEYYVTP
ncbi:MAG TPA: hypothetical protein VKP04_07965, partial [Ktedonobacteraceae bacterium]|nr:hypothetical protein [Ktedonobacteraceae bacterium]